MNEHCTCILSSKSGFPAHSFWKSNPKKNCSSLPAIELFAQHDLPVSLFDPGSILAGFSASCKPIGFQPPKTMAFQAFRSACFLPNPKKRLDLPCLAHLFTRSLWKRLAPGNKALQAIHLRFVCVAFCFKEIGLLLVFNPLTKERKTQRLWQTLFNLALASLLLSDPICYWKPVQAFFRINCIFSFISVLWLTIAFTSFYESFLQSSFAPPFSAQQLTQS